MPRKPLLVTAAAVAGAVFVLFVVYERAGLGLGHFFYLAIALAAMAGGPRLGALAGGLATGLFLLAVLLNPEVPSAEILTAGTLTRLTTYVSIGALIGWFASRNRAMVAELKVLAERDVQTGLPNTRAFEAAITERLQAGQPFALLLADMESLSEFSRDEGFAAGNEALRRFAETISKSIAADDDVARVGNEEFAVLVSVHSSLDASRRAAHLEQLLASSRAKATVGWALHPHEGDNALALYRAANERLYARKVMRSYVRPRAALEQASG